jgi:hypothetical protein
MVEENVLLYITHTMEKEYEGYITTELERHKNKVYVEALVLEIFCSI